MKVLDHMDDFIKMSKVWSLSMEFYGAWQLLAKISHTPCDVTRSRSIGFLYIPLSGLLISFLFQKTYLATCHELHNQIILQGQHKRLPAMLYLVCVLKKDYAKVEASQ